MHGFVRVALVAACLGGASAASADSIGIEGGLNLGATHYRDDFFGLGPSYRESWSVGLRTEQGRGRFRFLSGLRYIEYPERFTLTLTARHATSTEQLAFQIHETWSFLALPVRVSYRPTRFGGYLVAGTEAAWLAQSLLRVHSTYTERFADPSLPAAREEQREREDETGAFERWSLAFTGGAGWEWRIGERAAWIEARYLRGLTEIDRGGDSGLRLSGVELVTGLR